MVPPVTPAVATVADSSAIPPGDGLSSAAADAAAGKPGRAGGDRRSAQGMGGAPGGPRAGSGLLGMGGAKPKGKEGAKGGAGAPHLRGAGGHRERE